MNILFASHADFYSGSSIHVFGFANQLVRMGHGCAVAVPKNKSGVTNLGEPLFKAFTFDEVQSGAKLFENADAPDILHCWSAREPVRRFAEPLREKWRCKLAVHLEENEELVPKFLESADGITVASARLKEFLPYNKPVEILWPGIDFERFKPAAPQSREKQFAGLEPGGNVLAYTGNVHAANREEMRTLYLALGILNARGVPTKLLRTGEDLCPFLSANEEWTRRHEIKLGRVEWTAIPGIINAADVLVQPGIDDARNAYRLPAKLPEFMAIGKAMILPPSNLGCLVAEGGCAIILQTGCPHEIAACAEALFKGPELRAHLGASARRFAQKYFNWENSGKWIERFHRRIFGTSEASGVVPLSPRERADAQPYRARGEGDYAATAEADERNPVANLTERPSAELPDNQAAYEQLMMLNAARWPAIIEAMRAAEARLEKVCADGVAARNDFEKRLEYERQSRSWRAMRLLRRMKSNLLQRREGGWAAFYKWLYNRSGAPKKLFDPFEEPIGLQKADFDRSPPEKK